MAAVQTTVLLPIKPLSAEKFEFRHNFKAKASLLLTQQYIIIHQDFVSMSSLCGNNISMLQLGLYFASYIYIYRERERESSIGV